MGSRGEPPAVEAMRASYDLRGDLGSWLDGLVRAAARELQQDVNPLAMTFSIPSTSRSNVELHNIIELDRGLGSGLETMQRVQAVSGAADGGRYLERTLACSPGCDTMSSVYPRKPERVGAAFESTGYADCVGIFAMEDDYTGYHLAFGASNTVSLHPRVKAKWAKLAAHGLAGLRLRKALADVEEEVLDGADAIFSRNGTAVHATASIADDPDLRGALRRQVLAIFEGLETRGKEDALVDVWTPLVRGTWSVIDHFDTDGKRYLVFRTNRPDGLEARALTRQESLVAALAARAHSVPFMSYLLGCTPSSITTTLKRALQKLSIPSRSDLIRHLAPFAPSSPEERSQPANPAPPTVDNEEP